MFISQMSPHPIRTVPTFEPQKISNLCKRKLIIKISLNWNKFPKCVKWIIAFHFD